MLGLLLRVQGCSARRYCDGISWKMDQCCIHNWIIIVLLWLALDAIPSQSFHFFVCLFLSFLSLTSFESKNRVCFFSLLGCIAAAAASVVVADAVVLPAYRILSLSFSLSLALYREWWWNGRNTVALPLRIHRLLSPSLIHSSFSSSECWQNREKKSTIAGK